MEGDFVRFRPNYLMTFESDDIQKKAREGRIGRIVNSSAEAATFDGSGIRYVVHFFSALSADEDPSRLTVENIKEEALVLANGLDFVFQVIP